MTTPSHIAELHSLYCQLTGLPIRYEPQWHDSDWFLWSKKFEADDLKLVVAHIQKHHGKDRNIMLSMLSFRHLICQRDYFGEYLAQAKAMARNARPAPSPKAQVLAAMGRPAEQPKQEAKPVCAIVAKLMATPAWQLMKKEIGMKP